MELKSQIMDSDEVKRTLVRMAHEITEKNKGVKNLCLVGIKRRGIPLAKQLAENIKQIENVEIPCGTIDIAFYRDDLSNINETPIISETNIPFDVTDKIIVLVDDVIYTGRTVRAAIDGIFDHGRPAKIQLAALIDRGHRELPIRPDFVGKSLPTSQNETVSVNIYEYDGKSNVELYNK